MIDNTLTFLKNSLNAYFKIKVNLSDSVVFTDQIGNDSVTFENNKVTMLLINIEEDRTSRKPDLFSTIGSNGKVKRVNPEIKLNLMVLFVVKPAIADDNPGSGYGQAIRLLSHIIKFFQTNRAFDRHTYPSLKPPVEEFYTELVTLPLERQNDIWNALRTTHLPSVMYKLTMSVFRDDEALDLGEEIFLISWTSKVPWN